MQSNHTDKKRKSPEDIENTNQETKKAKIRLFDDNPSNELVDFFIRADLQKYLVDQYDIDPMNIGLILSHPKINPDYCQLSMPEAGLYFAIKNNDHELFINFVKKYPNIEINLLEECQQLARKNKSSITMQLVVLAAIVSTGQVQFNSMSLYAKNNEMANMLKYQLCELKMWLGFGKKHALDVALGSTQRLLDDPVIDINVLNWRQWKSALQCLITPSWNMSKTYRSFFSENIKSMNIVPVLLDCVGKSYLPTLFPKFLVFMQFSDHIYIPQEIFVLILQMSLIAEKVIQAHEIVPNQKNTLGLALPSTISFEDDASQEPMRIFKY
jgi:hypothetical protein